MANISDRNKRVVKNTLLLYVRTILVMCISLFTSRLILSALGVNDFGVYNAVASFLAMFGVISASLSNAIMRFITFVLGQRNEEKLSAVFSTSLNIQFVISGVILLLAETLGVWFLNYRLNIPDDRLFAANVVLQFSLITFIFNLVSLPYNALIVAYERMNVFAYISILEVALKLVIVYCLVYSTYDKLITYSILLAVVAIIIRGIYSWYCLKHFPESRYKFVLDKSLLNEMTSFSGWNFLGTSAYIVDTSGVDIVSNLFFGVTVNAARGVANQASNAVKQFVNNFVVALNPQIVKTYAEKDLNACFSTVIKGAKYSYFLMLFFFIPFVLEAEIILRLWLKDVPEYAVIFWQLTMLGVLVDLPGAPLTTLAQATGEIRKFYCYMSVLGCLVLPISYIWFYLGGAPYVSYIAYAGVYTYLVFVRLFLMKNQVGFPVNTFMKEVILPLCVVTCTSFILPMVVCFFMPENFLRLFCVGTASTVSVTLSVLYIGMKAPERKKLICFVFNKIQHNFLR